jgi:hypothetical protein
VKTSIARVVLFLVCIALSVAPRIVSAQGTQLYWGDTHLHTSHSLDAFQTGNFNADPDTAFRFAKGLPVLHSSLKVKVHILRPLDFLVVSDHAENLALQSEVVDGNPLLMATTWGKNLQASLKQNPAGGMRGASPADVSR